MNWIIFAFPVDGRVVPPEIPIEIQTVHSVVFERAAAMINTDRLW